MIDTCLSKQWLNVRVYWIVNQGVPLKCIYINGNKQEKLCWVGMWLDGKSDGPWTRLLSSKWSTLVTRGSVGEKRMRWKGRSTPNRGPSLGLGCRQCKSRRWLWAWQGCPGVPCGKYLGASTLFGRWSRKHKEGMESLGWKGDSELRLRWRALWAPGAPPPGGPSELPYRHGSAGTFFAPCLGCADETCHRCLGGTPKG